MERAGFFEPLRQRGVGRIAQIFAGRPQKSAA
jgi:hypothetical protein